MRTKKSNELFEVIIVFFVVVLLFKVFEMLLVGNGESQVIVFRTAGYLVMFSLPALKIILDRSGFSKYGITLLNMNNDISIALSCIIPIYAINIALHLFDWRSWDGAFAVVLVQIAVLIIVLNIVNTQSDKISNLKRDLLYLSSIIIIGSLIQIVTGRAISDVITSFIRFFIIAAPIEEFFFRGYVQTKLNDVFDTRFSLFGVNFGWGLILASLLFGTIHVFNPYNPLLDSYEISLPWGLWTTMFGFILGLIREKTNSLTAPILLHAIVNFL